MQVGDRVIQTACFENHQFHEGCFNNFLEHVKSHENSIANKLCPICRAPIEEDKLVKKILTKDPNEKIEDMFGLDRVDDQTKVVNENQFAKDAGADNNANSNYM